LRRADLRRGRPVEAFIDKYFTGTATSIEGVGLRSGRGNRAPPRPAYGDNPIYKKMLDVGGMYQFACAARSMPGRRNIASLQHAVRGNIPEKYKEFADHQRPGAAHAHHPWPDRSQAGDKAVPLDEVEPASEIVKRFATGAMSLARSAAKRTPRWPSR
jgi:glutamate synthase (NADPH/NADH) large chain